MRIPTLARATLAATVLLSATAAAEFQRGYIYSVGSTTVFPYAKAVGERFSKARKLQLPLLQSTGSSGGIKLFCEGTSGETPDIVNTSRAMKPKERQECRMNGVSDILEVKIGYDGLVMAQSKHAPTLSLTRKEGRLALAKWVAGPEGTPVPNPNKAWKQINPALPDTPIAVFGPSPASGIYDAFVDLISEAECKSRPWVAEGKTEPTQDMLRKCRELRNDGAYVEGSEHDEEQLARLSHEPGAVAILDYKAYTEHSAQLRAVPIDGQAPDPASIASRAYPGARPLFLYVKGAHLGQVPGLKEYVAEFSSEHSWGDKGYLKPIGLIPLFADERAAYTDAVKAQGITPSLASAAEPAPAKAAKSGKPTKLAAKSEAHHDQPKAKSHK